MFLPLRQGQIQSFTGIHRKIVAHIRYLSSGRLGEIDEDEKNRILRLKQIYESMNLRTNEVKELKSWFTDAGIDVEKDNLSHIEPIEIIIVLEEFFDNYLSKKPDTYFGGIRTDRDLEFELIGWHV